MRKFNIIGKLLLTYAAFVALHPSYGQTGTSQALANPAQAPPSIKFDVVSFKPCEALDWHGKVTDIPTGGDYVARRCQPLTGLINFAFSDLGPYQLKNEPEWVDTEPYDFLAKVAPEDVAAWQKIPLAGKRLMGRAALAEALNLKMHIEQQTRPIYALVVAKDGPKLTEYKPGPDEPPPVPNASVHAAVHWLDRDHVSYSNASMNDLASGLAARLDRTVVNQTGLTGRYDFTEEHLPYPAYDPKSPNSDGSEIPAILDGVKSLGLRLEPAKADTSVIVIDHIERPHTN
jgi:bla regulator protein BlaR1